MRAIRIIQYTVYCEHMHSTRGAVSAMPNQCAHMHNINNAHKAYMLQ